MQLKSILGLALGALLGVILGQPLLADEFNGKATDSDQITTQASAKESSAKESSAKDKTKAKTTVPGRDPVALAFALPKGTVLSDKQQKAFEKLKSQHEPALHAALDQVAAAKGQDAKTKATAAMGVRDERAKIRAGIQQILAMPYQEALDRSNKYGQANSSSADGNSAGAAPGYNNNYTPAYNDYYYRMYGRYPVGAPSGGYYTYGYYNAPNATSSNSSKPKSGGASTGKSK